MKRASKILMKLLILGLTISLLSFLSKPEIGIQIRTQFDLELYLSRKTRTILDDLVRDSLSTQKKRVFNSSILRLQSKLTCIVEEGVWLQEVISNTKNVDIVDGSIDLSSRTSRRFNSGLPFRPRFQLGACSPEESITPTPKFTNPTQALKHLCSALPRKKILFVGPETTYHLHTTWLEALEQHENRSYTCLGSEFCTFHNICRVPRTPESNEPYFPPGGFQKYPSNRELERTRSAVLKYILSTSLYGGTNPRDERYTSPYAQVGEGSGVRRKEAYWIGQARKADVVVMNRGPEPAPAWTYDKTQEGNWTFLMDRESSRSRTRQVYFGPDRELNIQSTGRYFWNDKIVEAALEVTRNKFLPEVLKTLNTLENESAKQGRLHIWHSSWYMPVPCVQTSLKRSKKYILDPWALYYNAQVYMQNYLLQILLPHYGMLYLPLSIPMPQPSEMAYATGGGGTSSKGLKDCLRYEYGSPLDEAMRTALLSSLLSALGESI